MDAREAAPSSGGRSAVRLALGALPLAGLLWLWALEPAPVATPPSHAGGTVSAQPSGVVPEPEPPESRPLSLPSGEPVAISCEEALRVTGFLARELAAPGIPPTVSELSEAWLGMLDPHGMWSAAPDSPLGSELTLAAPAMLASLHQHAAGCAGLERAALVFEAWSLRLAGDYDAAFAAEQTRARRTPAKLFELLADPIFEDDPVTRPGQQLARELGTRLGALAASFPDAASLVEPARSRFFPQGRSLLTDMMILAALRAYVPLVDPHGDFAPIDEEWALYAGDSTLDGGSPLWGDVVRTPLGARVTLDPAPPLELDDVVLAVNGFSLAGASIDQIEQAARSPGPSGRFELRVLRQGEPHLLALSVEPPGESLDPGLRVERIPLGQEAGDVLRVEISDVGDWLGADLAQVLEREAGTSAAVLLDLRGNGGGSLDAAVDVLGLFLPEVPLFPLIRRGAVSEVLQAPAEAHPYRGPLAALVDGDTASAAEMIAGGIQAYSRGLVIGARTFGKGCVQEYFDQVTASGVLRMTTLQFVLPNGKPLQQLGLSPDLTLPLPPALERESQITRQPISFDGPDVREPRPPGPAWPRARGEPGACSDALVCRALARLAGARPGAAGGARAARPRAGMR